MNKWLLLLLFLLPITFAQHVQLDVQGTCTHYNVTVSNLEELNITDCYDLKVDATTPEGRVGEIFDPRKGWKSSFYYVKEFCSDTARVQAHTRNEVIHFKARIKKGGKEFMSKYYDIHQQCPQMETRPVYIFLISLAIILILLIGVRLYKK